MTDQRSGSVIVIHIRSAKETKQLTIHENATGKELKYEIAKEFSTSPEEINLVFAGKYLKDREKLKDKNIGNGFTVFLKPVFHQEDDTPSTSRQGEFSGRDALEFYRNFPQAFDSTTNSYSLSENRQAFLSYYDDISRHFSTVISSIFNPEILLSFNLQNVNTTLLQQIVVPLCEIVLEPVTNSEPLNTEVLESYLTVDSRNLISNPETLRSLVMIAESSLFNLDARIVAMLVLYLATLESQDYPVANFRRMFGAFLTAQLVLQVLDATIADLNINTSSSQDSTTSTVVSRYRLQLEELENMGFLNREENLGALTTRSGNIRFAVDALLKTTQDSHGTASTD